MRRIDQVEAMERLMNAKLGSHIRVRYAPGRPPSTRAIAEAQIAVDRGLNLLVHTGSLESIGLNRRGQFFFTLLSLDRNHFDKDGAPVRGAFRSFSPALGQLFGLRVIR